MGIAVGDFQNSGRLGIFNTTFSDDAEVLYRNDDNLSLTDISAPAGIASLSMPFLSWGAGFLDFDHDGLKDLLFVSGHVYPQVDQHPWGTSFAEKPLLLRNLDGTYFVPVEVPRGSGLATLLTARGAACGDLFNYGRIDIVINNQEGTPTLLRNVSLDHHHWIEFRLIGSTKSPRDATGAKVFVTAHGIRQRGDVLSGGSFVSSTTPASSSASVTSPPLTPS